MRRQADVLVATTIIESGIDIPTANTMIINDADLFGLADLHQLRGRVGRYKHRAYCYLLPPADRTVKRGRPETAQGDRAVLDARRGLQDRDARPRDPRRRQPAGRRAVRAHRRGRLRDVLPSARGRGAYRRIAAARSATDLDAVRTDLTSAYGEPPKAVERLLDLAELRASVAALHIRTVTVRGQDVVFLCPDPGPVVSALGGGPGTVRAVDADLAQTNARSIAGERLGEVYFRPPPSYFEPSSLLRVLRKRLTRANTAPGRAAINRD
jgi:transcription-repair coupling factor (superfamily II helicase)